MNACLIGGGAKEAILRQALETTSESPTVLIIPSACSTTLSYDKKVGPTIELFERLGTTATVLHEFGATPSRVERDEKFGRAAVIYTIGGHTPTLLESLNTNGTGDDIRAAIQDGKMLAGVSAGAILPFSSILICPAKQPKIEQWDFEAIPALGILRAAATAHADMIEPTKSASRLDALVNLFPALEEPIGFGIENGAAMLLLEDGARVIRPTADSQSQLHVVTIVGDISVSRRVEDDSDFFSIMQAVQTAA